MTTQEKLAKKLQHLELKRLLKISRTLAGTAFYTTEGQMKKAAYEAEALRFLWCNLVHNESCQVSNMTEAWQYVDETVNMYREIDREQAAYEQQMESRMEVQP